VTDKRENREEKLDRELRDHLELDAEAKMNRGLDAEQARYSAQRDFGNTTLVREVTREMWAWSALERFIQDLRFGLRTVRRNPGFTAVAILTLALGIGANAAMFSITDTVLLRPLPYPDADRLISISADNRERGIKGLHVSFTRLTLIQEQSRTLESVGGYFATNSSLTTHGFPEQVAAAVATRSFFDVLRISPSMGRGFTRQEDQPGGANVAIISDAMWHGHFGGESGVIGKSISVDGRSVEIIGVLPASFRFPFQQPEPQMWFPRVFENPRFTPENVRAGSSFLAVIARLRPGETISHAQLELDSLNDIYRKTFPSFHDAERYTAHASSLKESLIGPMRTTLLVLLVGVGAVLLTGCTNLASLLLAQATLRRKEMAIRGALGASRGQMVLQLLTESLLLSFIGGGLGLALAAGAPRLLSLLPPGSVPRLNEVAVDARVVWFSLALCVLTGVLFGLVPALQVSGKKLHDALKDATRGSTGSPGAGRSRTALIVAQVAFALVLASSAGLLLRSFGRLMHVSPGFDPHHVMTFAFSLPQNKYPQEAQQAEFYRRLVESVQSLPTVQFAAANTQLPSFDDRVLYTYICPQGIPCQGPSSDPVAALRQITPDYFKAMRIPLVRGRFFNEFDRANSRRVCIVNDALANQFFSGQDPVGKYIVQAVGNIQLDIVGVVGTVKYAGLNGSDKAELYYPQQQSPFPVSTSSLVVRSDGSQEGIVSSVREIVTKLDPDLPMTQVLSMDDVISASVAPPRLTAQLTAAFAILALLLAAIGIYGVMAYSVARRKHEMAIRIALGASPGNILRLITQQGFTLVALGVMIGTVASLALTRFFATILFQISARDPLTLGGVAGLLIAVGMLACYIPARRAMSVDPITALRNE
jgi:predicted permease